MHVGRILRAGARLVLLAAAAASLAAVQPSGRAGGLRFNVHFGPEHGAAAVDGRLLVLVSRDESAEPRFQINDGPKTQQAFGFDV